MDETTMHLTKTDRAVLESYKILCDGLANYLGEGYEIALHSLENYGSSVIKIINGYYTGRKRIWHCICLRISKEIKVPSILHITPKTKRVNRCIRQQSPFVAKRAE